MRILLSLLFLILTTPSIAPTRDVGREALMENLMGRIRAYDLGVRVRGVLSDVDVTLNLPHEHLLHMERMRDKYGIPFNLFYRLVWYENRFIHDRSSPKGAVGYMQIMPSTFRWISERVDVTCIHDPFDNIEAGAFYLSFQRSRMGDDDLSWVLAVASYNAGYSRHREALIHFRETIDYIAFVF